MKRVFVAAVLTTALFVGVTAAPAPAVVHEIYAAWCAGKGEIEPPGLSREGSKNFAMPVLKSGAVSVHPFTGAQGPGLLVDIDFTKPQVKIIADRPDHRDRANAGRAALPGGVRHRPELPGVLGMREPADRGLDPTA